MNANVSKTDSLQHAVNLLGGRTGQLPIIDDNNKCIGVISSQDILAALKKFSRHLNFTQIQIGDLIS